MLGEILAGLTNPATAETMLATVARPAMRERASQAAAEENIPAGDLIAGRVRHMLDHGSADLWVDLLGAMAGSPQPAAAAVDRILNTLFPDPVRVRITRKSA